MVRETPVSSEEMSRATVGQVEKSDTRGMDYKDLAQRYGIRESEAKRMTAEGDWTNLIVDVYLPRLLEGESYDSLREELKKFMADLDGFHPGSGPYVRLMDIFQQVMRSGSSEKKDKLLSGETREQYMERMKAQRERNNS